MTNNKKIMIQDSMTPINKIAQTFNTGNPV